MRSDRRGPGTGRTDRKAVARVGALVLLAATAALLTAPDAARPGVSTAPPALAGLGAFVSGTACSNGSAPARVLGTVRALGGPAPGPDLGSLTVGYTYRYELLYSPQGGTPTIACETRTVSVAPAPTGSFAMAATVPASFCTAESCSNFTGPFGPAAVNLLGIPPAGYETRGGLVGAGANLTLVYVLQDPNATVAGGLATVSPNAPTGLYARAVAADGEPAPLPVVYAWTLDGPGWSATNGSGGALATVEAAPGAPPASLTVWANGTFNGAVVRAQPERLVLTAVPTAIDGAEIGPTGLDSGSNASVTFRGSGAAGYPYSATVSPGLGLGLVSARCLATPSPGGEVALSCSAAITYGRVGVAQPWVELTNGYSTAYENLTPVSVAPGPALTIDAGASTARVGLPFAFTVAAVAGTGTPPYDPACLDPGFGTPVCANASAAAWTFSVVYPRAGTYAVRAWTSDAAGLRTLAAIPVTAAAPLALAPGAAPARVSVGQPVTLAAAVGGGAAPIAYWWNATDDGTSLPLASGERASDGAVTLRFVAPATGSATVVLTVEDALGSRLAATWDLGVGTGPAAEFAVAAGPSGDAHTPAGAPARLSFVALAATGAPAEGYAGSALLTIARGGGGGLGPGWVNDSGLEGSRAVPANGTLSLAPTAWNGGYLNLTVALGRVGLYAATLRTNASVVATAAWWVGPDPAHLRLFDPRVVVDTASARATLWRIADRFGNAPAAGTVLTIRTEFGGTVRTFAAPVREAGGTGAVWINYTLPAGLAGEVEVVSPAGEVLWGPVAVAGSAPSVSSLGAAIVPFVAGLAVATAVGALGVRRAGRRRAARRARVARPEAGEIELHRLAEGRASVERALREGGPLALDAIRGHWSGAGAPPDRAEVAEWVASLVAEGAVRAVPGFDGGPRFALSDGGATDPPPAPRVQLDPELLERALARSRADADQPGGRPTSS